jgi:predicted Zn-dependent peptidase
MEKKVILEEIQMYLDQPPFGMDDKIKQLHMGSHPLARSVLGTSQTVGDLTPAKMRDYFESRYSADNVFVAAAGKVDFDALVEQVAMRCGDWTKRAPVRDVPAASSRQCFEVVHRPSASQEYVLQLADAPSSEDPDRYAAKLLATIIGDDSGSRMYWELTDSGLAETASLGYYEYLGAGMFYTWLACEPDMAEDNLERVLEIYRAAERDGFNDDELQQAKNKVKSRVVLGSERPQNRLFNVGGNWLQRREYRTVADDLRSIDSVSIADMQRVLAKYPLTRMTTIAVGPRESVRQPR